MPPELSIVIPMRNEAPNVDRVIDAVCEACLPLGEAFEIVCIDDGSEDDTLRRLDARRAQDDRIVVVSFSRCFGKEGALAAGLTTARGQAVILMDADLQHPPALIPTLVDRWREGYDVVEAVRDDTPRGGSPARWPAASFYALMGSAAGARLEGSSDFKLLDRQVVDVLAEFQERNRFFRGLVAWVGFRVARVPFVVPARAAGDTKWSRIALARYALRNVLAFSSMPLRLVAWLGFVIIVLDVALGLQTFWNWWRGAAVTGFTTVILTVVGLGGLILLSLGVIAIYLAQMYEELKGRPVFVIRRDRHSDHPSR